MGACSSDKSRGRNISNVQTGGESSNLSTTVDRRQSAMSTVGSHSEQRTGAEVANGVSASRLNNVHQIKSVSRNSVDAAMSAPQYNKSHDNEDLGPAVWDPVIGELVYILKEGMSIDGLEPIHPADINRRQSGGKHGQ